MADIESGIESVYLKNFKTNDVSSIDNSWRTATIFSKEESLKNENEKFISDQLIYKAVTKLNMTSELFVAGGFRKPSVRKIFFDNNFEREKDPCLQFRKLYDSTWVITTEFCSINLVEGEANETPRETIFIYDPFHEASYQENLNEIKYLLSFVQDCNLVSQPFVKVNFIVLKCHYAIILAYCELQFTTWQYWSIIVHISERRLYL